MIFDKDASEIVLSISTLTDIGTTVSSYLILSIAKVNGYLGSMVSVQVPDIPCNFLSVDVTTRIREPLALMSSRNLVFFDQDRWICSWRLAYDILSRP